MSKMADVKAINNSRTSGDFRGHKAIFADIWWLRSKSEMIQQNEIRILPAYRGWLVTRCKVPEAWLYQPMRVDHLYSGRRKIWEVF